MKIEGLEGRGEARLPIGLGVRAAASYAKGTMRTAGVGGTLPLDSVDPFKLVAGAFYEPAGGPFRADLTATHSSGKKAGDVIASCSFGFSAGLPCYRPNGFWTFDATASLRMLDRVTLRGGVFNITDRKYFWWSDVRGVAAASNVIDAYSQPGRKAALSLSLTF